MEVCPNVISLKIKEHINWEMNCKGTQMFQTWLPPSHVYFANERANNNLLDNNLFLNDQFCSLIEVISLWLAVYYLEGTFILHVHMLSIMHITTQKSQHIMPDFSVACQCGNLGNSAPACEHCNQGWHSCASARHRPFFFSLDAQI